MGFGDKRLDARFLALAQAIADQPMDPINQACGENRAEQKAAYRFFANDKTESSVILQAHQSEVVQRAARLSSRAQPWVLAIQDTSFLNFSNHVKTEGLGKIANYLEGRNKAKGLVVHTTLALDPEQGLPLGILDQQIWSRPTRPDQNKASRHWKTPIEKKESYKWIRALEAGVQLLGSSSQEKGGPPLSPGRLVTIADRESDIFEFLDRSRELGAHFLIRAQRSKDRVIIQEGSSIRDRKGTALHTLWSHLPQQPVRQTMEIEVPRRAGSPAHPEIPARRANVEVRFCPIQLALPRRTAIRQRRWEKGQSKKFERDQSRKKSLSIYAVWVYEPHPPKGEKTLDWLLLTDLPVETLEQAQQKIQWYGYRWRIESFHKVLKSGCRVEACRLETAERLQKYITLCSIIAWKILWATLVHRQDPGQSCQALLSEAEWKALYCRVHRTKKPPPQPPTLQEALSWIAQLGGYAGGKSKKRRPGTLVLWRGWQRLNDITETWEILNAA